MTHQIAMGSSFIGENNTRLFIKYHYISELKHNRGFSSPSKLHCMKKIIVASFSLFLLVGCANNEKSNKVPETPKVEASQSNDDLKMQEWMQGKHWQAENDNAPMTFLKLKMDGTYENLNGSGKSWKIENGQIDLYGLTEWPVKKIDDSTFSLYVKPTDKTYLYKKVGIL